MTTSRQRRNSDSAYYHHYRCPRKMMHGTKACPMPRTLRAEGERALDVGRELCKPEAVQAC